MSRRAARLQPAVPYHRLPVRRLLIECNRRFRGARGPRVFEAMAALIERWPQVQSGVVYLGDGGMGKLMGRCAKTAHRAKYDLARSGLIVLEGAGPGVKAGGKILNAKGQPVAAATGYRLAPELLEESKRKRPAGRPPSEHESPAQARLRREGAERIRRSLEAMRARPGP